MNRARSPFPLATLALAMAVVGTFAVELATGVEPFCLEHGFVPANPSFETALVSLFLHAGWAHLGANVVVLLVVGSLVERSIGSLRFLSLFVAGGLAGAGLHLVADQSSTLVGCSGSLFAVLAVAAVLYGPAVLVFVVVLALTNIAHAFGLSAAEGVSFGAHCGGLAAGALLVVSARVLGGDLTPRAVAA